MRSRSLPLCFTVGGRMVRAEGLLRFVVHCIGVPGEDGQNGVFPQTFVADDRGICVAPEIRLMPLLFTGKGIEWIRTGRQHSSFCLRDNAVNHRCLMVLLCNGAFQKSGAFFKREGASFPVYLLRPSDSGGGRAAADFVFSFENPAQFIHGKGPVRDRDPGPGVSSETRFLVSCHAKSGNNGSGGRPKSRRLRREWFVFQSRFLSVIFLPFSRESCRKEFCWNVFALFPERLRGKTAFTFRSLSKRTIRIVIASGDVPFGSVPPGSSLIPSGRKFFLLSSAQRRTFRNQPLSVLEFYRKIHIFLK